MTAVALVILILSMTLSNFTLFSISASAEPVRARINFSEETITVSGGTGNGVVRYMYSPNVNPNLNARNYNNADARRMAAEKWFPIYGDTIDISMFIPRAGEVVFAFRDADELPNADGVYLSRETSEIIPARPNISQATLRNNARYETSLNAPVERIRVSGELLEGYEYKVGISQWLPGEGAFIDVDSRYNAAGGTIAIRKIATGSAFASGEFKMKLPRAPAAPKLRVNNNRIIGIKMRSHMWSTTENGTYREFTYSSIDLWNFAVQMGADQDSFATVRENDKDYIAIFVRVPATDRRPSSEVQRLLVPVDAFSAEPSEAATGQRSGRNNNRP